jgi:hypothetical protein
MSAGEHNSRENDAIPVAVARLAVIWQANRAVGWATALDGTVLDPRRIAGARHGSKWPEAEGVW